MKCTVYTSGKRFISNSLKDNDFNLDVIVLNRPPFISINVTEVDGLNEIKAVNYVGWTRHQFIQCFNQTEMNVSSLSVLMIPDGTCPNSHSATAVGHINVYQQLIPSSHVTPTFLRYVVPEVIHRTLLSDQWLIVSQIKETREWVMHFNCYSLCSWIELCMLLKDYSQI